MTDRASAPGRASGAPNDCWNSQASCADPHCVKHRGDRAIPLPSDRPATAEEVAASAKCMMTKHAKSLEQLPADDTSDPAVRASGAQEQLRQIQLRNFEAAMTGDNDARSLWMEEHEAWLRRLLTTPAAALSSPSVADSPTPPLFIPLRREFYDAFATGAKKDELRRYGPRWNERTCAVGRSVVLSCGYGKAQRLTGRISSFKKQHGSTFGSTYRASIEKVYGTLDVWIACIGIVTSAGSAPSPSAAAQQETP